MGSPGWQARNLGKNLESTAGSAIGKLLGFSWHKAELLQGKDSKFSFLSPGAQFCFILEASL